MFFRLFGNNVAYIPIFSRAVIGNLTIILFCLYVKHCGTLWLLHFIQPCNFSLRLLNEGIIPQNYTVCPGGEVLNYILSSLFSLWYHL